MPQNSAPVDHRETKKTVLVAICLTALVLLGAGLRLTYSASLPIWLDEAYEWEFACKPYLHLVQGPCMGSIPSFILVKWSTAIFGQSEWALRLPSLLLSLANIPAIYWLGRKLVGPGAGLLLAALLATDPMFVQNEATARHYGLWLFAIIILFFTLIRLNRYAGPLEEAPISDWLLLACALAFVFWAHLLSAYLWLSVAAVFAGDALWRAWKARSWTIVRRMLGRGLVAYGVAAILVAPWLYMVLRLVKQAAGGLNDKLPASFRTGYIQALIEYAGTPAFPILFLCAALGLLLLYRRNPRMSLQLFATLPAGLLAVWCVSLSHFPIGRYFYPFFLPIYIGIAELLAAGWQAAMRRRSTMAAVTVVVIAVAIVGWRTIQTLAMGTPRMSTRFVGGGLLRYVKAHGAKEDLVVAIPPHLMRIADFYDLGSQCADGNYNSQEWSTSGFGYGPEDVRVKDDQTVWIVIQTDCNHEPWLSVTRKELAQLMPAMLGKEVHDADLDELCEMNIIKVRAGKVWVARAIDVVTDNGDDADTVLTRFIPR